MIIYIRGAMKDIRVLGTGCPNCNRLVERTREAVDALGIEATITKVTSIPDIMAYGVMSTPALVVDGTVVLAGRVPLARDLERLLVGTD